MRNFKRLLCFATAAVLLLTCLSGAFSVDAYASEISIAASGTQNRTEYFTKTYELTGNYVDDYLNIARTQLGRREEDLYYTEAWCANFVCDCARLTGMPDTIIPYNYSLRAGCRFLYSYMLENCNAQKIENPEDLEPGDLVFYYCPAADYYLHVGIVETPGVFYIEGNYSDQVRLLNFNYNYKCYEHYGSNVDFNSGHVKRMYLRPNYGFKATPKKVSYLPDDYTEPTATLLYDDLEMTYHNGAGWVQAVLYQAGFIDRISGAYDERTEQAVIKYQKSRGLEADGIVGKMTRASLEEDWRLIKYPRYTEIELGRSTFNYFHKLDLSTKAENADTVKLILEKDGKKTEYDGSSHSFDPEKLGEGSYTAYFRLTNKFSTVETKKAQFTVKLSEPDKPVLSVTDAQRFSAAVFDWEDDDNAVSYTLTITDHDGKTTEIKDLTDTYFAMMLPEGIYEATVSGINKYAENRSDAVGFTVESGDPLDLGSEFFASVGCEGKGLCAESGAVAEGAEGTLSSRWYFVRSKDGSYTVKNCGCGAYLSLAENNGVTLDEKADGDMQRWYIGKNDSGNMLISAHDSTRIICLDGGVFARQSNGARGESLDIRITDSVHSYTITSYKAPDDTHDGRVVYTCSVTGGTHTVDIPCAETQDTPDTPDVPDYSSLMIGDVNEDKAITAEDALLALRSGAGIISLGELASVCADINFDLEVNSADAIEILRCSAGMESAENIGKVIVSA